MIARCLGSSSSGNCYLLQFSNDDKKYKTTIMIEAGFSHNEIKKRAITNGAIFMLSSLDAVLITHLHSDHAKGVQDYLKQYIDVYATEEVFNHYPSINDLTKHIIQPGNDYCIGEQLFIYTFNVEHDAPNSIGFIIYCKATDEKVLFINDCKYVQENLSSWPFDYVFIECNYEDVQMHTIYNQAVKAEDKLTVSQYKRVIDSHMSLVRCQKTLARLNLAQCKAIFLMHLSDRHANEYLMKTTIEDEFGVKTYVCQKNGGIK